MIKLILLFALSLHAGQWSPAAGEEQIPLWPKGAPGAKPPAGPETTEVVDSPAWNVAGKPWVKVLNVARPTMTVYPPRGKNTGAAVVVFPGGGYNILAIDLEGTEICDWLTGKGIACVLLKYRVPCEKEGPYRNCKAALQDAQRAIGLLRSRADEWKIDPHKIGVMGFSAGGHMVVAASTQYKKREYEAVDKADDESCRPDFAIALYPGHLAVPARKFALNPDVRPTADTPPTLLIQSRDDPVDPIENSLVYYEALRKAGANAELHVFAKGGHAFGVRWTKNPVAEWPKLAEAWLASIGMTGE